MLRRTLGRLVGVEGDIHLSVCRDKEYIARRIAEVGRGERHWKPTMLSDEDITRLTTSSYNKESYFNKMKEKEQNAQDSVDVDPTPQHKKLSKFVVEDEEWDLKHGPTRYGDWEKNGRCIDF
eukprot:PhM_4_TR18966/c0_g1_i1/m.56105